jgi:hypothetical protein
MATNRKLLNDFRDAIHAASRFRKNIQRNGQNGTLFQSLLSKLPDPNNTALLEDATILDTIRNHLCEENEDGSYRYALVPVVAVGVATQFSKTRNEFDRVAGLHGTAYRTQIRNDLFYWNHCNETREGLRQFRRALRWLYHHISPSNRPAVDEKLTTTAISADRVSQQGVRTLPRGSRPEAAGAGGFFTEDEDQFNKQYGSPKPSLGLSPFEMRRR